MYSDRLKQFIDTHRPEEIHWSVEEARALAEKAGLRFDKAAGKVASRGQGIYAILGLPVKVVWSERLEGRSLIFEPQIRAETGWFRGYTPEPEKKLLAAAGIDPVAVELPEPVVTLPRAPWDYSFPWDWGSGMVEDTLTCFRSEAEAEVASFCRELRRLVFSKED